MRKILLIVLLVFSIGMCTVYGSGTVTDTITVKVGYWGMNQEDYIEKASYHWSELDDNVGGALESRYEAYSFYREGTKGDYMTVIDSARGFYIEDLIGLAGISLRDIQSISFYTADKDIGYFTSFTYSELFNTERYYFNNLSSYFTPVYDEAGEIETVLLDDNVWNDKKKVRAMLALEDSWESFDPGTEYTGENYASLSAGNRFRLLFGQTHPTEMRTNQTAKFVHTLYVTLKGTPKVVEKKIKLENKVGAHTVTFKVSTGDEAFIQDVIEKLKWNSSDEEIMKIKKIKMETTGIYEDAINVTIEYQVLKEGQAFLEGSYGGVRVEGGTVSMGDEEGKGNAGNEGEGDGRAASGMKVYYLSDQVAKLLAQADQSQYEKLEVPENKKAEQTLPITGAFAAGLFALGVASGIIEFRKRR